MEAVFGVSASANISASLSATNLSGQTGDNSAIQGDSAAGENGRGENTAREAVPGGDGTSSDIASTSASTDTFQPSEPAAQTTPDASRQRMLEGMYIFAGRLNAQMREVQQALVSDILTPEMAMNNELARQRAESVQGADNGRGGRLREAVDKQLISLFGENSQSAQKFGGMLDDLYELNPAVYGKTLIMLMMIAQNGGSSLKDALEEMGQTLRRFSGATGVDQSGRMVGAGAGAESVDAEFSSLFRGFQSRLEGLSVESVQMSINVEVSFEEIRAHLETSGKGLSFSAQMELIAEQFGVIERVDPLVLDLAGNGINLTGVDDGVEFDIRGDGKKMRTAFIQGDDAFLFLDKNGNGVADCGKELFGDQNGAANGFAELAKYDMNNDGVIDEHDEIYAQLRLWQDINRDGACDAQEVMTLLEAGVRAISLAYQNIKEEDGKGNALAQVAGFTRLDGSSGRAYDVLLSARAG